DGGDARAGEENTGQVERVDRADTHVLAALRLLADAAQRLEGFGERVLLADEAGHEAAAADGSPRLETAQRAQDLAPRDCERLLLHHVAEHDAVAFEEYLRHL